MKNRVILEITARRSDLPSAKLFPKFFEEFELFALDRATTGNKRQGSFSSMMNILQAWDEEGSVLLQTVNGRSQKKAAVARSHCGNTSVSAK